MHPCFRPVTGLALALLAAGLTVMAGAKVAESTEPVRFNRDIRPILSDNCFACHGPDDDDRGGELRLDVRGDAIADRGSTQAIAPGRPDESEILRRLLSHDPDEVMPPPRAKKPKLAAAQIELLRRWIREGAVYQTHWAFEPLEPVPPPVIEQTATAVTSPRTPIDHFILARLREEGLRPSPPADPAVLLRRVSLDLVGLQPTVDELDAFLKDESADAYERVVDRLLASPHYGERWGRHWLDQARYADSNGYSIDAARAMWPWRDWVIAALNQDMPFDQFTIEQLAGDLLPQATRLQRIATGFHRNTMINQEGGTKPEQFRNEAAVDRVNTTGAVWLGLTVGCAQCHSHKYDPLTHKEYFQLFGFFNSDTDVNNAGDVVEVVQGEIAGSPGDVSRAELDAAERAIVAARSGVRERLTDWLANWPSIEPDAPGPANAWAAIRPAGAAPAPPRIDGGRLEEDGLTLAIDTAAKRTLVIPLPAAATTVTAVRVVVPATDVDGRLLRSHAQDDLFVLSRASLEGPTGDLPVMAAFATGERPKFAAAGIIDTRADTGWSIGPQDPVAEAAVVLVPRTPLAPGVAVSLRLEFAAGNAQIPRRLRIETTGDPQLAPLDPAAVGTLGDAIIASRAAEDGPREADVLKAFAAVDLVQLAAAFDRDALRRRAPIGQTMVMRSLPQPRQTFVHLRGDYLNPDLKLGPLMPDTPGFLPPLEPAATEKRSRLDLARWLVRPDNPLTPRVTVNRVWMRYFGTGLVETENDFGTQGSVPTHPELLDWLAAEFIRGGWSLKKLHRLIVTSAVYRQASVHRDDLEARDPRNLLLGRQNRIRLDAEVIRDTALLAAGLLSADLGGPSVYPPQPEGVYAFTQAGKPWPTATGPQRYRRSLYTQFYRSAPHPLFTTFDAPNFSTTCTRRLPSNTPLQSLMLANDPIFVEAAAAIGDRVAELPGSDDRRLDALFELCLARRPSAAERSIAADFLRSQTATGPTREDAWRTLARGILNTDNFVTRE